ncbi:solute carrier family 26 member 10-like isoform X1 [Limulus polyphemus]|uniref:Solute carrier family 26 member 10-like isoform X1 n=1 Tax=Limulus polyphemus TaxID=6850 RepID=A0ABM1TIB7_LIMPO|nr:solute carrier family 26 member 10-like isoform X1 [Limulus polyphemus]
MSDDELAPVDHCEGTERLPHGRSPRSGSVVSVTLRNVPIKVKRQAIDQEYVNERFTGTTYPPPCVSLKDKVTEKLKKSCSCTRNCVIRFFFVFFPIIRWLPQYQPREYLLNDLVSGFTILILHIPQGMAYGLLASVDPVNGLYVSFFPVLVYFLMGTSRHISVGTFAVVSLMISSAVSKLGVVDSFKHNASHVEQENTSEAVVAMKTYETSWPPSKEEAIVALSLATGLLQVLMGLLRLGSLSIVLSDHLISGFSTGAAVHVATSQIRNLFDIHVSNFHGPLKIIFTYINIFSVLAMANPATVVISAIAIFVLALVKEQINARFRQKLKMPVPIDLIVVVISTVASYLGNFNKTFGVEIMGHVPTGIPAPVPPRSDLLAPLATDAIAIAIVSYAVALSLAKTFAKRNKYTIDPNQELIALGTANTVSSFFSCFPCAASLSRSLVQERTGGCTQIAGLVSSVLMLVVLLVLAPMFYNLPKCILSCVILVALKGMFMQFLDLKTIWSVSRVDALIWIVTFLSVVLLDVDIGLMTGVIFSILTVIYRSVNPHQTVLGVIPNTEVYLDKKRYSKLEEIPGIKIFHFGSALYFMNRHVFLSALKKISVDEASAEIPPVEDLLIGEVNDKAAKYVQKKKEKKLHHIVIDCSSISYLDATGVEVILEVIKEMKKDEIAISLAACSVPMYELLDRSGFFSKVTLPVIFPTIHDAVLYAQDQDPEKPTIRATV